MSDQYIENITEKVMAAVKPYLPPMRVTKNRHKRDKELHDKIYKVIEGSLI